MERGSDPLQISYVFDNIQILVYQDCIENYTYYYFFTLFFSLQFCLQLKIIGFDSQICIIRFLSSANKASLLCIHSAKYDTC